MAADAENGTTATPRNKSRGRKTTRGRKSTRRPSSARGRQRWAVDRASGEPITSGANVDADRIVEGLVGSGFMKPLTGARKRYASNVVGLILRGSK